MQFQQSFYRIERKERRDKNFGCFFFAVQLVKVAPFREDSATPMARVLTTQRRKGPKAQRVFSVLATLQCYIGKLRIFGKIFPPLLSLCAPVQVLWLRLAALRLGDFALNFLFCPCTPEIRGTIPSVAAGGAAPFALQSVRVAPFREDFYHGWHGWHG